MFIYIPDVFLVPIVCAEEDILNVKKIVVLNQYKFHDKFINKTTMRKIGISLFTIGEGRWLRDKEAMESYAKEKGVTLKIENADFDTDKQVSQVEDLISQGVDVLIIAPAIPFALSSMVEKAHNAGIKVISYEALLPNSDVDLFVAFNSLRVGELQGRFLTDKVPKGRYIIMSGDPYSAFKEGAMEYIQPLVNIGSIKIVADKSIKNWDPKITYDIVKDSLIANKNKIDAILAPNDPTAGAAIKALQEQDLAGKVPITGQDADLAPIRRIIQGTQSMTVFKDTRELAKASIDAAIKLANGKPVEVNASVNNGKIDVPGILITPIAIDQRNIDNVLIASGYLTKEEVYKR